MRLTRNALVFVAKAQVKRHSFRNAPVILHEARIQPLGHVASGVSGKNRRVTRVSGEKVLQWSCADKRLVLLESDSAPASTKCALVNLVDADRAAGLERVLANQMRDLVDEIVDVVRPYEFGKIVKTTHFRKA